MNRTLERRKFYSRPIVRRLRTLAGILRAKGELPTAARVGLRYEWSYKTIYRDIEMMRDFWGWPLAYDKKEYKWKLVGEPPEPVL